MTFKFSVFLTMLSPKGEKSLLCSADTSASCVPVLMLLLLVVRDHGNKGNGKCTPCFCLMWG